MKVVQINAIYGAKSTGVIMKDIHEMLLKDGQDSYVVAPLFAEETKNSYKIGNILDYKIHALLTRITGKQAYYSCCSTRKLIKYLDEIQPDIIHFHNLHGNYINLNMLMKYIHRKNISLVITMHDCWFFTGKCFHYVEEGCQKWQNGCFECPRKRKDVPNWFLDHSKKVYSDKKKYIQQIEDVTIVGPSQWICDEANKTFMKEKNICCIYNGVDKGVFKEGTQNYKKENRLENKFIILGMANKWLHPKNKTLVQTIIDNLKEDDLIILLGVEAKDVPFETSKIKTIPYIEDRRKLADIYDSADVFVNLTLADTFPTVNMEAICCGTPVVTHDVGGCIETIEEETGVLVSIGDTPGVLDAIDKIREVSYDKCASIGNEKFSKEANYQKYIQLYYQIEDGRKQRKHEKN